MSAKSAKDPEDVDEASTKAGSENENFSNTCNGKETSIDEDSWEEGNENGDETSISPMKCFSLKKDPKSCIRESPIPTTIHNFKYIPFFSSPKYLSASIDEKVGMLREHHEKLRKQRAILCSKSLVMAPLPPPIILYKHSDNKAVENNVTEVVSEENTYVSRFGRCTKRKNYTETLILQDKKEVKVEDPSDSNWLSKNSSNKNTRKRKKNGNGVAKSLSEEVAKRPRNGNESETSTVPSNEPPELDTSSPTSNEKKKEPHTSESQPFKQFITRKGTKRMLLENESVNKEGDDHKVCPICSKTFPVDEIENHASSCGEMR